MHESAGWQFELEIHPAQWRFPAGRSWVAGWIRSASGQPAADLRAWIDGRPFLGLHGQPRPAIDARFLSRPGPPYHGFSLLLEPAAGARTLRLEAREAGGGWRQFFQTAITTVASAAPSLPPPSFADLAAEKIPRLLREQIRAPDAPPAELANEIVAATLAVPLDSLPNPPFHGALEEPRGTGGLRYGRLSVTGWLGHRERRIRRLTAMVDPWHELPVPHGMPRHDVAANFPPLFILLTRSAPRCLR